MHAHRIDVLNRTDDDEVVGDVAHHLELELFPADDRLFDQDLVDRAHLEPALRKVAELFDVVRDAATDAPRVNDGRMTIGKPSVRARSIASFGERASPLCGTSRPIDRMASLNSCRSSATLMAWIDAPINWTLYFEHARVREIDGEAERGLTSDGWKERPASPRDDAEKRHRQRLDDVRSASSGSVMIVAGLLFTRTTSSPSARSALHA